MPKKKGRLKPLPRFATEDEESDFWETHDSTDYIDWHKAKPSVVFPNLKRSKRTETAR